MLRDGFKHGFSDAAWSAAKAEACAILMECARRRGMITYSDLVAQIQSVKMKPHDSRLAHFLGEISAEEDAAGRGMLTVLVVHKTGDMEPGPGFYELAQYLERDVSDPQKCWIDELHRVHREWSSR